MHCRAALSVSVNKLEQPISALHNSHVTRAALSAYSAYLLSELHVLFLTCRLYSLCCDDCDIQCRLLVVGLGLCQPLLQFLPEVL